MKISKISLISIITLSMFAGVFAQKFAYVNSQKISMEYQESVDAQNKFKELQNQTQVNYAKMVKEYQTLANEIESQSLLLSPEKKQEKMKLAQQKAMEVERFKYEKLGPQGELYKKQAELLQPVIDKINAAIQKVGEEEGYDMIFDGSAGILYANPGLDITQKVLDELNSGKSKK